MEKYPKISIVTVNLNQGAFLEETIKSVLNQNYPNLEYIIIDGGSTDNSIDIIKRYEKQLTYWISEKDEGQYAAVQKGFAKSTGDILAWINSDDLYVPNSFYAVAEIFNTFPNVNWLMGVAREYNEEGVLMSRINLNWCRWSKYRFYTYDFQFIQQESSFWRRELWEKSGARMTDVYKLAGDMELWTRFFRDNRLYTTTATLAGFRYRKSKQRSVEFRKEYLLECQRIIENELRSFSILKHVALFFMRFINLLLGPFFFADIPMFKGLYRNIFWIPKVINYDFDRHKYVTKNIIVKYPPLFIGKRQIYFRMFEKK